MFNFILLIIFQDPTLKSNSITNKPYILSKIKFEKGNWKEVSISLYNNTFSLIKKIKMSCPNYPLGGNIYENLNYNYNIFNTSNNLILKPLTKIENADILLIGGGGGGGKGATNTAWPCNQGAGGGGSGGLILKTGITIFENTSIIVGDGGLGSTSPSERGKNGGISKFGSFIVNGGGGGGSYGSGMRTGGNGASGGGATSGGRVGDGNLPGYDGGIGILNEGNNGGRGNYDCGGAGGGGGKGSVGNNYPSRSGGKGGNGWNSTLWFNGYKINDDYFLAGGGGGSGTYYKSNLFGYGGLGGLGGGGNGGNYNTEPTNGKDFTGSGGGGGTSNYNGKSGGKGLVVVKFEKKNVICVDKNINFLEYNFSTLNNGTYHLNASIISENDTIYSTETRVIIIDQNYIFSHHFYYIFFLKFEFISFFLFL